MKKSLTKILTTIIVLLLVMTMTFGTVGCFDNAKIAELQKQIDELKNAQSNTQANIVNVFTTDKKIYTQNETVKVSYSGEEIYSLTAKTVDRGGAGIYILVEVEAKVKLYFGSIQSLLFLEWNDGIQQNSTINNLVIEKNTSRETTAVFGPGNIANTATYFNLIIAVPGTGFPLATITDIPVV